MKICAKKYVFFLPFLSFICKMVLFCFGGVEQIALEISRFSYIFLLLSGKKNREYCRVCYQANCTI